MVGRLQLQRLMRTSLVSLILAILVLPAVALRTCPMTGVTTAAACCCCDDEEAPEGDAVERNRKSCCESSAVTPAADALVEATRSHDVAPALVPTVLARASAPFVRELPPRVRGPPDPGATPVYIRTQSLLL